MSAATVVSFPRPGSAAPRVHAPPASASASRPRGGLIWIGGVAGVARSGLVATVRVLLEPSWTMTTLTPAEAERWVHRADADQVGIVASSVADRAEIAVRRTEAEAAGLAFTEILVVSDWDALVERTDSTLFAHLAAFFARLGHAPAPRPSTAGPDTIVQLDWHGPVQIAARVTEALTRGGLIARVPSVASRQF